MYDVREDPDELNNLVGRQEHAEQVEEFTRQLTEHLRSTARVNPQAPLDELLQPADVKA